MPETNPCSAVRLHGNIRKRKLTDMVSVKMWVGSVFLNIWALIDRSAVSFFLGSVSTVVVIAYHVIKIRKELKNKND